MADESTNLPPLSPQSAHLPALDGVRGLAILLVMFMHFTVMTPQNAFDTAWFWVAAHGWIGVDLFFVLSGFLITGILLDSRSSPHYFRNFYIRRTLRIFPLYYAVVFLSLVVLPHFSHPKIAKFGDIKGDEIWYWTYLSNYLIANRGKFRHGILDVSWSLAIEEQFYLLWPMIVWFCSRRVLKIVSIGLVFSAVVFRFICVQKNCGWLVPQFYTPARMDGLAVGAMLAILVREPGSVQRLARFAWPTIMVCMSAFASLVWLYHDSLFAGTPREIYGFALLALSGGSVIVLALTQPEKSLAVRFFRSSPMRMLGKYSYAIYLMNFPLRAIVRDLIYRPEQFAQLFGSSLPGQFVFYALAGAITLLCAILSWNLFEKHFLKLKDRLTRPHSAAK